MIISSKYKLKTKKTSPGIIRQNVMQLAKGQMHSGKEAYQLGLLDALGYLNDAIDPAARISGIKGKALVVKEKRRLAIMDFFGNLASIPKLIRPINVLLKYKLDY